MNSSNVIYKTKTATQEEIYSHLSDCNYNFIPPLDERVNIQEYSKKIVEKSVTFEAWANTILVGFVAAYFNDIENHSGYITNVSITKSYMGLGIASKLLNLCIGYAREKNFNELKLEVNKDNAPAINFYKRLNFSAIESKSDNILMKFKINYER